MVGGDAIRVEEGVLPAWPVVPLGAPGGNGEVGSAVGHAERSEIHVAGPPAVVIDDRVRSAYVAVAHHRPVDIRSFAEDAQRLHRVQL